MRYKRPDRQGLKDIERVVMIKHLLSVADLTPDDINRIFDKAASLKKEPFSESGALENKVIGLVFQKPSTRTRVSFEVGSAELGAHHIYLGPDDIEFGKREPIKDVARVLSRYMDLIILRTFSHDDILEFARFATVPVINGLSDLFHPCQALGDIFTVREKLVDLKARMLCFVGDGNNVLHSLLYCSAKMGMNIRAATPKKYGPNPEVLRNAVEMAKKSGSKIELFNDPRAAAKGADIIYTDVWVSMGQEKQRDKRLKAFRGFQVNSELLGLAKKGALIMHCLPAHRGEEITDEALECQNSIVFDQAENRLHVQKAILMELLK